MPWPTFMDGVQVNTFTPPFVNININDGKDVNVYDGLDDQWFSCNIHTGCLGGGEVVACAAKYAHDYPFGPDR